MPRFVLRNISQNRTTLYVQSTRQRYHRNGNSYIYTRPETRFPPDGPRGGDHRCDPLQAQDRRPVAPVAGPGPFFGQGADMAGRLLPLQQMVQVRYVPGLLDQVPEKAQGKARPVERRPRRQPYAGYKGRSGRGIPGQEKEKD